MAMLLFVRCVGAGFGGGQDVLRVDVASSCTVVELKEHVKRARKGIQIKKLIYAGKALNDDAAQLGKACTLCCVSHTYHV